MRTVDQTQFGKPQGNCMQACLATLLDVPLEGAPAAWVGDGSGFNEVLDSWHSRLNEMLAPLELVYIEMDASVPIHVAGPQRCVLVGPVARGPFLHAVVGRVTPGHQVELLHDPNPCREGLTSIERIGFLVRR